MSVHCGRKEAEATPRAAHGGGEQRGGEQRGGREKGARLSDGAQKAMHWLATLTHAEKPKDVVDEPVEKRASVAAVAAIDDDEEKEPVRQLVEDIGEKEEEEDAGHHHHRHRHGKRRRPAHHPDSRPSTPFVCDKKLTFEECELSILRHMVDTVDRERRIRSTQLPEVTQIMTIVKEFIRDNRLVIYGGTAINMLLPKEDQFYSEDLDIPDYDFYTSTAFDHALELADLFYARGFNEVEARSAQHHGTYKVFVNFMPVADITQMPRGLLANIRKESVERSGLLCAPPNLLRMGMYLELSRPLGDSSRFEKVLKRLALLNKAYPLDDDGCQSTEFQRPMNSEHPRVVARIYDIVRATLIRLNVVFFGGFALSLYARHMDAAGKDKARKIPDFDVLSTTPQKIADEVKRQLDRANLGTPVTIIAHPPVGELIARHYEVRVGENDTFLFVYEPLACHSYNSITEHGKNIRIATIDTMLSFYLAFVYADRAYYQQLRNRILCMAHFLFLVQQKNRLAQHGVLKRFSINCIGKQTTLQDMRAQKTVMHKRLAKSDPLYQEWFLHYRPADGEESDDSSTTPSLARTKT